MRVALLVLVWCVLSAGCASAPPDSRPVAEDPVCLANGDLGCVRVRVDERTPRAAHKGVTYYFCADRCRAAFVKDPERYTGGPTRRQDGGR